MSLSIGGTVLDVKSSSFLLHCNPRNPEAHVHTGISFSRIHSLPLRQYDKHLSSLITDVSGNLHSPESALINPSAQSTISSDFWYKLWSTFLTRTLFDLS